MSKEFKVGDKVWSIQYGNCIVKSVKIIGGYIYPVAVDDEYGTYSDYTLDGKFAIKNKSRSLFHGHDIQLVAKESEYEYKVLYTKNNEIELSEFYYKSIKEFYDKTCSFGLCNLELFEKSKRLVKK